MSGRRALLVRHDEFSLGGYVAERLVERGWELSELLVVPPGRFDDPGVEVDFGNPADHDLLVPLGAPWSVYDRERIGSWVGPELDWLRAAVAADVPVLGICFGAQALAQALGGTVERAERPEIGWTQVDSDVPELISPGPWAQWHYDRFTVPRGATELARNEVGPQAFVSGRRLGVQFHPEVGTDQLAAWLAHGGEAGARAVGVDPAELLATSDRNAPTARANAHRLVDGYLDTIANLS